jgi:hypothetical protein
MEKIQEGEYMSADPIVGAMAVRSSRNADRSLGFDIMDTHSAADACFWRYLSNWNGPRCR